jgi:8-oxo-dGTP pyrophosphatase MutT (NUDIX family)
MLKFVFNGGVFLLKSEINGLAGALPVRPGINGIDEYSRSSVMILMSEIKREMNFILQKRAANVRQGGEIGFPGGMFDPSRDRSPADTAIRETAEEMGITGEDIRIIGQVDSVLSNSGIVVDGFLGVAAVDDPQSLDISPGEVEKVIAAPVSFFESNDPEIYKVNIKAHPSITDRKGRERILFPAKELALPDMYSRPWGSGMQKVYVYRYENEVIWGITARFIYDIVKRIKSL